MQTINVAQSLSAWIWITFSIGLVAVITYIYSQGNWRITTLFSGTSGSICITISGLINLNDYLQTHFIGQFDPLGLPYRKAGPGLSLLIAAWPLWLIPTLILLMSFIALAWILHKHLLASINPPIEEKLVTGNDSFNKTPDIQSKIDIETLKHEINQTKSDLNKALEIIKSQLINNQLLEEELNQTKISDEKHNAELEDKILSLTLESQSKDEELAKLESQMIEQEEKRLRTKENA